nr:MAG: YopX protein [Bacteriophage sp.]
MIPKYRAWDKEFKEMVQVDAMVFDEQIIKVTYKNGNIVKEDLKNYVLMQSTGFRDKNGKEIFEGDIIDSTDSFMTGVVEFREALGMFVSDLVEYNNFERLCNVASSRKIIGNIWEHPELAEVSS